MANEVEELLRLGYEARREDRLPDAKAAFERAVELARAADFALMAKALTRLGAIHRDMGETEPALRHYQEAVSIQRELNDPAILAHTVRHVGEILREDDRLNEARPYYEESLRIYRAMANPPTLDLGNMLRGYALLKSAIGDRAGAKELWVETRELYQIAGIEPGIKESDKQIASLTDD
jgi:tetratricopeptide (TPR) repeat protein